MRSPLSLIVSILVLLGIALLIAVIGLGQEPDSGGVGRDTYGLRAHGYRGLIEVLGDLGIDARRRIEPPAADLPIGATYVLLAPGPPLVAVEPAYLHDLAAWVESGGRVVVAPAAKATYARFGRNFFDTPNDRRPTRADLFNALGLPEIKIAGDRTSAGRQSAERDPWQVSGTREYQAQRETEAIEAQFGQEPAAQLTLALASESELRIDPGERESQPLLTTTSTTDEQRELATVFPQGKGEIVVVADADLFANALLRQRDNSVAAVRLLSPHGGPVVFDEHYHGLSVRGNPLYLLTLPGFAAVTLAVLLASGIWAWRTATPLGPPVITPAKPRRDLREYVDAMARLLLRGTDGRRYLLNELRQGMLEELGRNLGLSVLTPEPKQIAAALARRDRVRAEAFSNTIDQLDSRLAQRGRLGVAETTQLMQRASTCL